MNLKGKRTYIISAMVVIHALIGGVLTIIGNPYGQDLNEVFREVMGGFGLIFLRKGISDNTDCGPTQ